MKKYPNSLKDISIVDWDSPCKKVLDINDLRFLTDPETRRVIERVKADGAEMGSRSLNEYQAFAIVGDGIVLSGEMGPKLKSGMMLEKAYYMNPTDLFCTLFDILVENSTRPGNSNYLGLAIYSPIEPETLQPALKDLLKWDVIAKEYYPGKLVVKENPARCPVVWDLLMIGEEKERVYLMTPDIGLYDPFGICEIEDPIHLEEPLAPVYRREFPRDPDSMADPAELHIKLPSRICLEYCCAHDKLYNTINLTPEDRRQHLDRLSRGEA